MSESAEITTDTSASCDLERIEEATNGVLHKLIDERIKANLGPLND